MPHQFEHCFPKSVPVIEQLGLLDDRIWILVRGYKEKNSINAERLFKPGLDVLSSRGRLIPVLSAQGLSQHAKELEVDQEVFAFGGAIDAKGKRLIKESFEAANAYSTLFEFLDQDSKDMILNDRSADMLPRDP